MKGYEISNEMSPNSIILMDINLKTTGNMEQKKKKGLLALLGLGAGAFAWWKYKSMTQVEKDQLHSKINDVGEKVMDTVHDVEATVKEKYDMLKTAVEKKADELK